MPLTDLDVHNITGLSATNQRVVQARRPMVLELTPTVDRCIGHMILEAASLVSAEFEGVGVPAIDYLENPQNAIRLLNRITGIVFDGDISYKNSVSSSAEKTLFAPAYEPVTEWWRSYFATTTGATTVTVLVD